MFPSISGHGSPIVKGGLDRKTSKADKSISNLQRSSMSQAGRFSSAKLGSSLANIPGKGSGKPDRSDKKGQKGGKGRKK